MSEPQPKAPSTLVWVWRDYLSRHWLRLTAVLLLSVVLGLVSQQFLIRTETGLRVIFDHGAKSDLIRICAIVAGLFAVRAVIGYVIPVLMARVSNDVIYHLRRDLLRHILTLDLAFFDRTRVGEILQRLVSQTQALGQYIGSGLAGALRDAVTVCVVAGYLMWKSPVLFIATLSLLPLIIWVMNRVARRSRQVQSETEAAMGQYLSGVEETMNGIRTVKIAGQEAPELSRLTQLSLSIRDLSRRNLRVQALILPSIDLASAFVYLLVIGGGGLIALRPGSEIDGAVVITYLLGMVMLIEPARLVAQFIGNLPPQLVRLDYLRAIFQQQPRITSAPGALCEFDTSADLRLEHVHFSYAPDAPVFADFSLTLPGGKVSAIVGETGSGKTTILSLLARLYDVQQGRVSIGQHDVKSLDIRALRSAFSVVSQDVVIFDASLWENIRYMNPEASPAQIRAAAEAAGLADLLETRGATPVGPKGAQLSGGQRQRIAIARAFLRDAPILLLDEATSALDLHTEDRIRGAMTRLMRGRTTVIVAHRLSAVSGADRIFVLNNGQLVEEGSHQELLRANGSYAHLHRLQQSQTDRAGDPE